VCRTNNQLQQIKIRGDTIMKSKLSFTGYALLWVVLLLATYAVATHAQTSATTNLHPGKKQGTIQPAATTAPPITGQGTVGYLTKWTGNKNPGYTIGDTIIFEDAFAKIGIGTSAPTSKLTVQGMIETTMGGYKFPDGTVQTTAASGLQFVYRDSTLTGNGTQALPLGVAVPLLLNLAAGSPILSVANTAEGGLGSLSLGGNSNGVRGGTGLSASGGTSVTDFGGEGLNANGGFSSFAGGPGLLTSGGGSDSGRGGEGVFSFGGVSDTGEGGVGVAGLGGNGSIGGTGIFAVGGTGNNAGVNGPAGSFMGNVDVQGNLNVTGSKNFKIDHPLDPENKYLYHAAIESSEVLNIYSGNTTTDGNGDAVVTLPNWFEAVNRDFRYQLTVVGTFAHAIVADEIKNNTFKIKTNASGVKVSWQVTGIRSDATIRKHPFQVEENKSKSERGSYLSPEAYDQPAERGIQWARNPQMMQQLNQQRVEAAQGPREQN
jgi:hypothetical protein